jgi:hypothetical protein
MMGANTIVLDNAQEITGVFNWQHEADILKFAERKGYQIIKDPVPESYLKNNE